MRWDTLFLPAQNENLMKDVGLIPYFMMKEFGFDAYIVSFETGKFTYLEKEVKGLQHIVVKNNGRLISSIKYIVKNAKKIDVLNLYHWGRITLICSKLYKALNKKGKLYVKLDMDLNGLEVIKESKKDKKVLGKIIKTADLVTVESKRIHEALMKIYGGEIKYLPNGFYFSNNELKLNKKKQILTVGRLGTKQKATEVLLNSFARIAEKIPEWNLVLVGSVEPSFDSFLCKYWEENKSLKKRVIFTGKITDKEQLNAYYSDSSVFALPSRWESFALVLLEAMSSGCYIVSTDGVSPIFDLIDSDKKGLISRVDDIDDFSEKLLLACNKNDVDPELIKTSVENTYNWSVIVDRLNKYLFEGN